MTSSWGGATVCLLLCAGAVAASGARGPHHDFPRCRSLVGEAGEPVPSGIEWRVPSEPGDGAAATEACDAVGPGVRVEPRASVPDVVSSLAVVSWNMHVGGGDLDALISALRAGRLTGGEPPAHLVLLLQEAFRRGPEVPASIPGWMPAPKRIAPVGPDGMRDEIVTVARAEQLHLVYLPSMRNGRDGGDAAEDRGNAILSTLPIADVTGIELPMTRQRRVALAATLRGRTAAGTPWHLRVVSAHLDASSSAGDWWLSSTAIRERQARYLASALGSDVPTILGADLNTWVSGVREPAARVLRRSFDASAGGPILSVTDVRRLDHVFLTVPKAWRVATHTVRRRFGSDHRPIVIRLHVVPAPAS